MNPAAPPEVVTIGDRLHRFHGGLRLRHNKKISCEQPITTLGVPDTLVIPLLQHAGEIAEPCVGVGQRVLRGERIAKAGVRGADVHAPSSGEITALEERPMAHATGQSGLCLVLRSDGKDTAFPAAPLGNWASSDPAEIRAHVRRMGIVGLGGAVFPTATKLDGAAALPVNTLILNGAECEPYISCDEMLMREHPHRVVEGALIMLRAVGAQRAVIAIEDQMGQVQTNLKRAAAARSAGQVEVVRIPKIYPEGGERQLIQTLTGHEVPQGQHPQSIGVLCHNVATAAAVRTAVIDGLPLIERVVTVTGNGVERPGNFLARIGTPVAALIDAAGGYRQDVARLVVGGPMMGYPLASDAEPVVKASNCLLALSQDDIASPQQEMPCIRCGDCSRVCPAQLMPQDLHFHIRSGQWDWVEKLGAEACIECGCCDFVCPSHIPLTSWFRFGKGALREQAQERRTAEHARLRHEAREARLARAKEEKAERLAQRKKKLSSEAQRKRQIAAAIERAGSARKNGDDQE